MKRELLAKADKLIADAVESLAANEPPDGVPDHATIGELLGIFDGPEYREYQSLRAQAASMPDAEPVAHQWDETGERCKVCGDKDWMPGGCAPHPPQTEPVAWKCFHCAEVFTNEEDARHHFGPSERYDPACQIDAARLRQIEATLARYQEEDTDLHREIYALRSAHAVALRREEEKGYARGLRDVHPPQAEPAGDIAELVKWARDMATGSVCKNLAMEMADALTSLSAQLELLATDKSVVRANLLRGTLARPDDVIFMHDTHGPFAEQSARIASLSAQLLHAQDQARLSERLFQDANVETAEKTARIASLEAENARTRELLGDVCEKVGRGEILGPQFIYEIKVAIEERKP